MDNETNSFYDAIAEYYPYFYRDWEIQLEREGLGLRSIFRNKGVESVVDVACGPGTQAVPLAQLGYSVVALDPSPGMLKKAQQVAEERGLLDKIQFERADFLSIPQVIHGPFDAVVCKGNALPHLLTDADIEMALTIFYELLRPGGMLVVGMRDFATFIEHRPRFLPGILHVDDDDEEFITFEVWEWEDGPPIIARQNLYIVTGPQKRLQTIKRSVNFRPLSTDEVKVVLLEAGFEDITEQPDRMEQVIVARKPLSA